MCVYTQERYGVCSQLHVVGGKTGLRFRTVCSGVRFPLQSRSSLEPTFSDRADECRQLVHQDPLGKVSPSAGWRHEIPSNYRLKDFPKTHSPDVIPSLGLCSPCWECREPKSEPTGELSTPVAQPLRIKHPQLVN